jgi:hypothetical protein
VAELSLNVAMAALVLEEAAALAGIEELAVGRKSGGGK